jgi:beta-1,4-mannosyltransferase
VTQSDQRPTTSGTAEPRAPLRVLMSPYALGGPVNPAHRLMGEALMDRGVRLEDFGRKKAASGGVDVVHVHWPERLVHWQRRWPALLLEAVVVLTALVLARRRGAALVWTAHNLYPHDLARPRTYRAFFAVFVRLVDLVVVLSDASVSELRRVHPHLRRIPMATVPHGHYRDSYPEKPTRAAARQRLGIEGRGPVFLTLGLVRRYKNVTGLVEAFAREDAPGTLLVAGRVHDEGLEEELRRAAGGDPRIRLDLQHISDEDVAILHGAADVVVLPYSSRSVLNSGAALLALSFSTPVVSPDTPSTRELQEFVGTPWVTIFHDGASEALAAARAAASRRHPEVLDLSALDWEVVAGRCLAAYRMALDRRRSGRRRNPALVTSGTG